MENKREAAKVKTDIGPEEAKKKMGQYLGDGDFEKLEMYLDVFEISPEAIQDPAIQAKVDEWLATCKDPEMEKRFPKALREKTARFLEAKFK